MLDILKNLQDSAAFFPPNMLIVPGLTGMILGLCLWLAGLNWARVVSFFLAVGLASVVVSAFGITNLPVVVIIYLALAVPAAFFCRKFLSLIAAATIAIALITAFNLLDQDFTASPAMEQAYSAPQSELSLSQSVTILEQLNLDFKSRLSLLIDATATATWSIAAVSAAIVVVAGIFLPRLVCSLACSMLGTTMIFASMAILLFFKKSRPIQIMEENWPILLIVAAGMVIFGTISQVLLCNVKKKHSAPDKSQEKESK